MKKLDLQESGVRFIKIGAEAVLELLYETINGEVERHFDISPCTCAASFYLDWETRQFICTVHKSEDSDGNHISLPKDILLEKLVHILPNTTDSILSSDPCPKYRQYSKEELVKLSNCENC